MNNPRRRLAVIIVAGVVLAALGPWFWHRKTPRTSRVAPTPPVVSQSANRAPADARESGLKEQLQSLPAQLRQSHEAGMVRLTELRQALLAASTNEASAAIRQFLDSKSDAPTGQGFKVGGNGSLNEAPTLRTFLLDYLGRIDPAGAAAYARIILGSMDSPDEWAVALRNLARGDSSIEGRALLEQKTGDLLRSTAWQENPSVGYLEAFDAAVYLGGTNLVPPLAELVSKQDNAAVAHAAYLALDRLVISDPAALLSALAADPAMMQGRELTRANYFARADARDPQQRQVLEKYLLDPQIGPAELNTFAGIYPNANFMISANLLTQTSTPDHASLTSRDAESLRLLQEWLADPRFAKVRTELEKAKLRLEEFVRQGQGR